MERILLVYGAAIVLTFALVLFALRGDETLSRKYARVRVRVNDHLGRGIPDQPRMADQPDEEFDMDRALALTLFGMMMFLIVMLLNGG